MSAHLRPTAYAVIVLLLASSLLPAVPARAQCTYPNDLYMDPFCYDMQTLIMMTMTYRFCFAQLLTMGTMGMTNWNCTPMFPTGTFNDDSGARR